MRPFNRFQYDRVGFLERAMQTLSDVYAARRIPRCFVNTYAVAAAEARANRDLAGLVWC